MSINEAKPNFGFERLFDQVPGSILVLDLKSEEVLASSATFRHTFGYKRVQSGTDIGSLKVFRSDQSKRASFERLNELYSKGVRRGADAHRRLYTVKDEAIDCRINWRIVEASGRLCCVLLLEDVTREYEAIKRLQHAEEHLGAVFTANPDAMAIFSPAKATFVTCNDRFYELTGFDRKQITGKSGKDLQFWSSEEDRLAWMRIPHHPATQSTLIWPGIPRPSGHLFHGHPAGQSERSDAGVALLVRVGWRRQFLRPFAH